MAYLNVFLEFQQKSRLHDNEEQEGGAGHMEQELAAPQQVQRPQLEEQQGAGDIQAPGGLAPPGGDFGPPRIDHAPQGDEIVPPGGDFAPQGHGNIAPPAGDDYDEDRKQVSSILGCC